MTAEKKDRKPLRIKNLADLKRHIRLGTELVATAHQYHPDIVGLTRVVTKVQTNGFYSKIMDWAFGRPSTRPERTASRIPPSKCSTPERMMAAFSMRWNSTTANKACQNRTRRYPT